MVSFSSLLGVGVSRRLCVSIAWVSGAMLLLGVCLLTAIFPICLVFGDDFFFS